MEAEFQGEIQTFIIQESEDLRSAAKDGSHVEC